MIAGFRVLVLVGLALGVIGTGWTVIQRLQLIGEQQEQIQQLNNNLETRRRIDEAVRSTPRDDDGSRGVLRDFIQSRQ